MTGKSAKYKRVFELKSVKTLQVQGKDERQIT